MIIFIGKLLSPNSGVSHKRFISLVALVLYIIAFAFAFGGVIIPDLYIESCVLLILGGSALTLINKGKGGKDV